MRYSWLKYDKKEHTELDTWNELNKDINKYALFDDILSSIAFWYHDNPDDPISNEQDFIFVVKEDNEIIAFLISNVSHIENEYTANINPIVVSPNKLHQGHGKTIVKELLKDFKTILGYDIDYFMIMVDKQNTVSINLFQKCGFTFFEESDGYAEYRYYIDAKK